MGCDYIDMNHHRAMARMDRNRKILDDLGFDEMSIQDQFDRTVIASCRECAALVWVGDITRVERLSHAYLHYGWHQSLIRDRKEPPWPPLAPDATTASPDPGATTATNGPASASRTTETNA